MHCPTKGRVSVDVKDCDQPYNTRHPYTLLSQHTATFCYGRPESNSCLDNTAARHTSNISSWYNNASRISFSFSKMSIERMV